MSNHYVGMFSILAGKHSKKDSIHFLKKRDIHPEKQKKISELSDNDFNAVLTHQFALLGNLPVSQPKVTPANANIVEIKSDMNAADVLQKNRYAAVSRFLKPTHELPTIQALLMSHDSCLVTRTYYTDCYKGIKNPVSPSFIYFYVDPAKVKLPTQAVSYGLSNSDLENDKLHIAIDDSSIQNLTRAFSLIIDFLDNYAKHNENFPLQFKFPFLQLVKAYWNNGQVGKFCTVYLQNVFNNAKQVLDFAKELDAYLKQNQLVSGPLATQNCHDRVDISLGCRYVTYCARGLHVNALNKLMGNDLSDDLQVSSFVGPPRSSILPFTGGESPDAIPLFPLLTSP